MVVDKQDSLSHRSPALIGGTGSADKSERAARRQGRFRGLARRRDPAHRAARRLARAVRDEPAPPDRGLPPQPPPRSADDRDRKSTRLNSSHITISYAVFCL